MEPWIAATGLGSRIWENVTLAFNGSKFSDRAAASTAAKQAMLDRFKNRPGPDDPQVQARQAEMRAIAEARAVRAAERQRLREEELARLAELERQRLAEEARLAEEEEARKAEQAARDEQIRAERKAARDLRYAQRKARQRKGGR